MSGMGLSSSPCTESRSEGAGGGKSAFHYQKQLSLFIVLQFVVCGSTERSRAVFLRIFVCSQSGNHPQEDSAKSGYEVQNFNHPSRSLATHSKTNIKN
jgi:hypothetical protein